MSEHKTICINEYFSNYITQNEKDFFDYFYISPYIYSNYIKFIASLFFFVVKYYINDISIYIYMIRKRLLKKDC